MANISDFVEMAAISISNAADIGQREKRRSPDTWKRRSGTSRKRSSSFRKSGELVNELEAEPHTFGPHISRA